LKGLRSEEVDKAACSHTEEKALHEVALGSRNEYPPRNILETAVAPGEKSHVFGLGPAQCEGQR